MAKITLFTPASLNKGQTKLQERGIDSAIATVPNFWLLEGAIRLRVRKAVLRRVEDHGADPPTAETLRRVVEHEARIGYEHPRLADGAENIDCFTANLRGPERQSARLETIARYTIVRMFELCMYDEGHNEALNRFREDIVSRMVELMAERMDPMAALTAAMAEYLPKIHASPAARERPVRLGKAARHIYRGASSSRGRSSGRTHATGENH